MSELTVPLQIAGELISPMKVSTVSLDSMVSPVQLLWVKGGCLSVTEPLRFWQNDWGLYMPLQ